MYGNVLGHFEKKKFQIKNATHKLFEKLVSFLFQQQVTLTVRE